MRAILQRVTRAVVRVAGREVARIGLGGLVLVGIEVTDTEAEADALADKLVGLRIFEDGQGKMNLAAGDVGGAFLVVSQFTLAAAVQKGRRPSFDRAAPGPAAEPLVELFARRLRAAGADVATGVFGATMEVELVNAGPVTFLLEAREGKVRG